MFGLIRRWQQARLRKRPLPHTWPAILIDRAPFYSQLDPSSCERFHALLKVFVWEKVWIGAGGLEITEEVQVVISAAAVRLVLYLDASVYDRLTEIVVYPSHYKHPDDDAVILGEAHAWGTVVLSWDAVIHGLKNEDDGHDTATHEFAHVLDRASGQFNGTPELRARADYRPWGRVLSNHFEKLRKRRKIERGVLRDYGATNEAEFFAVATESFFERPEAMQEKTPELYEQLSHFYGFDPAKK